MSDDDFDSLRKRLSDRLDAGSRRLNERLGRSLSKGPFPARSPPSTPSDQAVLQATHEVIRADAGTEPIGSPARYATEDVPATNRPEAPTGRWRCIVESKWVTIDLTASISADETLSGQGMLIYKVTNKTFQVSGGGVWTALAPDDTSSNWLFHFRLKPSNHAMFSWFAAPTESPNHLRNRFVSPQTGSVVETHCERIG